MEKKFYEVPELEVLDMEIEGALLAESNTNAPGIGEDEWD